MNNMSVEFWGLKILNHQIQTARQSFFHLCRDRTKQVYLQRTVHMKQLFKSFDNIEIEFLKSEKLISHMLSEPFSIHLNYPRSLQVFTPHFKSQTTASKAEYLSFILPAAVPLLKPVVELCVTHLRTKVNTTKCEIRCRKRMLKLDISTIIYSRSMLSQSPANLKYSMPTPNMCDISILMHALLQGNKKQPLNRTLLSQDQLFLSLKEIFAASEAVSWYFLEEV